MIQRVRAQVPACDERCDLFAAMLVLADVDPWGHTLREEIKAKAKEIEKEERAAILAAQENPPTAQWEEMPRYELVGRPGE